MYSGLIWEKASYTVWQGNDLWSQTRGEVDSQGKVTEKYRTKRNVNAGDLWNKGRSLHFSYRLKILKAGLASEQSDVKRECMTGTAILEICLEVLQKTKMQSTVQFR